MTNKKKQMQYEQPPQSTTERMKNNNKRQAPIKAMQQKHSQVHTSNNEHEPQQD